MIQARCAVCGTAMRGAVHACGRCESIYHPECWTYNDGCAIYGCRRVAGRPSKPAAMPVHGASFGATLGAAVMCGFFALVGAGRIEPASLIFVLCAIVLGAVAGRVLRHRRDTLRIALVGLVGPGLAYCALLAPFVPWMEPGIILYFPLVALCGMIAAPLALPCAVVAARFNDPELANERRQRTWLRSVRVAAAIAALLMWIVA